MNVNQPLFDRRPYTIMYYKDGKRIEKKRRPPPVLHEMLPKDKVALLKKKSDDFDISDHYTVKHISNRTPNTLQINNEKGQSTFVPYYDLKIVDKSHREPISNDYLLFP